jgi:hypothetical protein
MKATATHDPCPCQPLYNSIGGTLLPLLKTNIFMSNFRAEKRVFRVGLPSQSIQRTAFRSYIQDDRLSSAEEKMFCSPCPEESGVQDEHIGVPLNKLCISKKKKKKRRG